MMENDKKDNYTLRYRNYIENRHKINIAKTQENNEQTQEKDNEQIKYPDNWVDLIRLSYDLPPPNISNKSLGNPLLDFALDKSVKTIKNIMGNLSLSEIQKRVIKELKQNKVASKNSKSTLRFLRDINADIYIICPECGAENEYDWIICEKCKSKNTN